MRDGRKKSVTVHSDRGTLIPYAGRDFHLQGPARALVRRQSSIGRSAPGRPLVWQEGGVWRPAPNKSGRRAGSGDPRPTSLGGGRRTFGCPETRAQQAWAGGGDPSGARRPAQRAWQESAGTGRANHAFCPEGQGAAGLAWIDSVARPTLKGSDEPKCRARCSRQAGSRCSSEKSVTRASASGHSKVVRVDDGRSVAIMFSRLKHRCPKATEASADWIAKPLCSSTNGNMQVTPSTSAWLRNY